MCKHVEAITKSIYVGIESRGNHSSRFAKDRKIRRVKDIILSNEQTTGITTVFVGKDNIHCGILYGM